MCDTPGMPPLLGTFLLRDGAPPLPDGLPEYTFTLSWAGDDVRGEGTVRVPHTGTEPLSEVSFLLHGNDSGLPTTTVQRVEVEAREVRVDADARELLLHVSPPVLPGETLEVAFTWKVALRRQPAGTDDLLVQGLLQLGGQGGGDHGLQAVGDGITVLAGGFPMLAPRVEGRFAPRMVRPDAPIGDGSWNVPARWDVTVVAPPGAGVVTNLVDSVGVDGRLRARGEGPWDFVVTVYDDPVTVSRDVGGVTVRSWARRGDEAAASAVLDEACHALRFLERYGRYPYRELDLAEAALSGGAGGVEFGGLALVASFLYAPTPSGLPVGGIADPAEMRAFVVAHEVAHQWSPGLVGADAWASPIVDEPLAQYLAWRVLAGARPAAEADALFYRQVTLGYAAMRLLGGDDGVAARETTAFPNPLTYGGLVYGKAPHLYRALHERLGPDTVDRALAAAFSERTWTVVDGRSWLASLERGGAGGAVAEGERWWFGATGDVDLALPPGVGH